MLKHSGMLEPQESMVSPFDETADMELRWREWLRREHTYRYENSSFSKPRIMWWSYIALQAPL
jgi:hypothetical protein